jgi:hypothetical protein
MLRLPLWIMWIICLFKWSLFVFHYDVSRNSSIEVVNSSLAFVELSCDSFSCRTKLQLGANTILSNSQGGGIGRLSGLQSRYLKPTCRYHTRMTHKNCGKAS